VGAFLDSAVRPSCSCGSAEQVGGDDDGRDDDDLIDIDGWSPFHRGPADHVSADRPGCCRETASVSVLALGVLAGASVASVPNGSSGHHGDAILHDGLAEDALSREGVSHTSQQAEFGTGFRCHLSTSSTGRRGVPSVGVL
jgi:hypothetical protein